MRLLFLLGVLLLVSFAPCRAQTAFINEFHTNDANGGYIDYEGDGTNNAFTDLEFVEFAIETTSGSQYDASDVMALFYNPDGTYAGYAIGPSYWEKGERQGDYILYSYGPFSIPLDLAPDNPPQGALPDGGGAIALTWWNGEALHLIDFVSYGTTVSTTDDRYIGTATATPIGVDEQPAPASDTSNREFYSIGLAGRLNTSGSSSTAARTKERRMAPSASPLRPPVHLLDEARRAEPPPRPKAPTDPPPDDLEWTVFSNTATPGLVNGNQVLPVELVQMNAVSSESGAMLRWRTASETSNAGFYVEHAHHSQPFTDVGFVEGTGESTSPTSYRYQLDSLPPGRHHFRLRQVDLDGQFTYSRSVELQISAEVVLHVSPPAPTPFRRQATITLSSKQAVPLQVTVHDALGRRVATLRNEPVEAHEVYTLTLSASRHGLSSGLYVVRVRTPSRAITRKAVVVR